MIYLDTHVLVWLFAGVTEKLSPQAITLINSHALFISPMVLLELQYLYEIQRTTIPGEEVVAHLADKIGLSVCEQPFEKVIRRALRLDWTRDPFDRVIVAQAAWNDSPLLTKDRLLHAHYPRALWDEISANG